MYSARSLVQRKIRGPEMRLEKMVNDVSKENFQPRPYQIYLYEKAYKENCIIYLPTGTGKTYIAALLVKKLSSAIEKPYNDGGKRTIFIANTVALVIQQCQYFNRHTCFTCKAYTGDMNVDFWSSQQWTEEIEKNQILVMTPQIFLDLLTKSFIQLSRVNLIVFDECHRAVGDHPMRQIMQRFQDYSLDLQPRVLGLSASLLNANIKIDKILNTLKELEITMQSKIISVETTDDCFQFAAKPKELVEYYEPPEDHYLIPVIHQIIQNAIRVLNSVEIKNDQAYNCSSEIFKPVSKQKKLINILNDIMIDLEEMGLFGGSQCILLHMIQLEYLKKYAVKQDLIGVLDFLITQLMKIQKLLHEQISTSEEKHVIEKYSSPKILKLIQILKLYYEKLKKDNFCCIIFVQRRFTAKVLYHVLKKLNESDPNYKFLKPDFTVGYNSSPYKNARENLCLRKWNKEALIRFRNGICNCLIATDVVDEGIDIPRCTLIIRYFAPMDFRAYLQSKGRARHSDSYFIILSPDKIDYIKRYNQFQQVEEFLENALRKSSDDRTKPTTKELFETLYQYNILPYLINRKDGSKSVITEQNAISIVNMYCANLEKSKFFMLAPSWIKMDILESNQLKYKVQIILPIASPLRETIIGDTMHSIDVAKRSAAVKACIELYKMGELNDKLLPNKIEDLLEANKHLFPHFENEEISTVPGTYSTKRRHQLIHPQALYGAYPQPNQQLYLHIIEMKPNYAEPINDNRHWAFYNLLSSRETFGILCTKEMPRIPSLPVYMNVGELKINIKRNNKTKPLDKLEISLLQVFHTLIFSKILDVVKQFTIFDKNNQDNSFLIVPINENEEIDWDTIHSHEIISYIKPSKPMTVKNSDYEFALVTPNYRNSNVYVVTQVCEYLKANSCFPTDDFSSYVQYFNHRHDLVIENENQPMLEVKPISKKINCIKPRAIKAGLSKRKRANLTEDFEEHLVPELCEKIHFPSIYWLKATVLPSILHRISQLLIAEDLRVLIATEALSNVTPAYPNYNWEHFKVEEEPEESLEIINESLYEDGPTDEDWTNIEQLMIETPKLEVDILSEESSSYSWNKDQEPPDFERCADKIQLIDIEYYHQFMCGVTTKDNENMLNKNFAKHAYKSALQCIAPVLKMLTSSDPLGPSPTDVMKSLTTKMSNDVFNFERVETLGDSFLKFFVSLYLYQTYPTYGEGSLTDIKGKIVGNLNLYYCGKNKNIPGRMNVLEFSPSSNFITPAYSVDRALQKLLNDKKISANFLYEIDIPPNESSCGVISNARTEGIKEKLGAWPAETKIQTGIENFLGIQIVSDKSVADCVEALIGTYLMHLGIKGALDIVKWFAILPEDLNVNEYLYSSFNEQPKLEDGIINEHLPWGSKIEDRLGYKFKNRAYLLQAFTHSSNTTHQMTYSYQRLEFLGDAVLDFLLTVYIYENCGNLSPGELTDLRSALVNNVTFACLTVRYGLHTALLIQAPSAFESIDRFVKFQESKDYVINDELLWILLEEEECNMAEHVDVPKILGDIFESVIGAIYLDSGKNLQTVWNIIYSLMKTEIDLFTKNVPKQPTRVIYETQTANPKFSSVKHIEGTQTCMVTLSIVHNGQKKFFHGFGLSKKLAKCAAAKQALKYLKSKN